MEYLLNEQVTHKKYGTGNIIEVNNRFLNIMFDECEEIKKFKYPDSFDIFMSFHNNTLQKDVTKILDEEKEKKKEEDELKRIEYEKAIEERNIELKKSKKEARAKTTKATKAKKSKTIKVEEDDD